MNQIRAGLSSDRVATLATGTMSLAIVLYLPLIDGVFAALLIAGTMDTLLGMVQVGVLVFGGSATIIVLLTELSGSRRQRIGTVLLLGIPLIVGAGLIAIVAPTFGNMLRLDVFKRVAAVILIVLAIRMTNSPLATRLPHPGLLVLVGVVVSFDLNGTGISLLTDGGSVMRATGTAAIGVISAMGMAWMTPTIRQSLDLARFQYGGAISLSLLGLAIVDLIPDGLPLVALLLAGILAYESDSNNRSSDGPAHSFNDVHI